MKPPLSRPKQNRMIAGFPAFALAALVLAGCGTGSGGPPGLKPGMLPPGTAPSKKQVSTAGSAGKVPAAKPQMAAPVQSAIPKPPDADKAGNEKATSMAATTIQQAGNIIELASAVIAAGTNPFMSRLPKTVDPGAISADTGDTVPSADPFENVNLLGIIYNAKSPLALLSLGSGENQLVRKGHTVALGGGAAEISAINPDSVELKLVGTGGEKRTLSLPSIIKHAAGNEAGSSAGGVSGGSSGLDNLSRLSGSNPANVILSEP